MALKTFEQWKAEQPQIVAVTADLWERLNNGSAKDYSYKGKTYDTRQEIEDVMKREYNAYKLASSLNNSLNNASASLNSAAADIVSATVTAATNNPGGGSLELRGGRPSGTWDSGSGLPTTPAANPYAGLNGSGYTGAGSSPDPTEGNPHPNGMVQYSPVTGSALMNEGGFSSKQVDAIMLHAQAALDNGNLAYKTVSLNEAQAIAAWNKIEPGNTNPGQGGGSGSAAVAGDGGGGSATATPSTASPQDIQARIDAAIAAGGHGPFVKAYVKNMYSSGSWNNATPEEMVARAVQIRDHVDAQKPELKNAIREKVINGGGLSSDVSGMLQSAGAVALPPSGQANIAHWADVERAIAAGGHGEFIVEYTRNMYTNNLWPGATADQMVARAVEIRNYVDSQPEGLKNSIRKKVIEGGGVITDVNSMLQTAGAGPVPGTVFDQNAAAATVVDPPKPTVSAQPASNSANVMAYYDMLKGFDLTFDKQTNQLVDIKNKNGSPLTAQQHENLNDKARALQNVQLSATEGTELIKLLKQVNGVDISYTSSEQSSRSAASNSEGMNRQEENGGEGGASSAQELSDYEKQKSAMAASDMHTRSGGGMPRAETPQDSLITPMANPNRPPASGGVVGKTQYP